MKKGEPRRVAQALGLMRYRDGRTCKHGHKNPERFTSCGRCVLCHRATKKKFRVRKKNAKAIRMAKWGYDPLDLRMGRKARGLTVSNRPDLVRLRERRRLYGRKDRPSGQSPTQPHSS